MDSWFSSAVPEWPGTVLNGVLLFFSIQHSCLSHLSAAKYFCIVVRTVFTGNSSYYFWVLNLEGVLSADMTVRVPRCEVWKLMGYWKIVCLVFSLLESADCNAYTICLLVEDVRVWNWIIPVPLKYFVTIKCFVDRCSLALPTFQLKYILLKTISHKMQIKAGSTIIWFNLYL